MLKEKLKMQTRIRMTERGRIHRGDPCRERLKVHQDAPVILARELSEGPVCQNYTCRKSCKCATRTWVHAEPTTTRQLCFLTQSVQVDTIAILNRTLLNLGSALFKL